jgi:hypothetical protein
LHCHDYEVLTEKLRASGIELIADDSIPGVARCYIHDPFGNRMELIRP